MSFPSDFVWGAATSSYQIEGAVHEGGRGDSIWDLFCRTPGAIYKGHNGFVACDHYHRYAEDADLLKGLGAQAYRFSIAWPRIQPTGVGPANQAGLDFYDRLVDALLARGIDPYVTLYHWDLPTALHYEGGWANPDIPQQFGEYTTHVAKKLGDRVKNWMTHNEPQCSIYLGCGAGIHAPGWKRSFEELRVMVRNVLLSHGYSTLALKAEIPGCKVGMAPVGQTCIPASRSAEDIAAAKHQMLGIRADSLWEMPLWLDPIVFGEYREDVLRDPIAVPHLSDADLKVIHQPMDFLGLNIYSAPIIKAGEGGKPTALDDSIDDPLTAFRWLVRPESLYWGPKISHERYGLPIYITENGLSNVDWVGLDGKVQDPQRIDFTRRYLTELGRAVDDGVPVEGYFHWSLLDNFEWAEGYKERFGLIHVDFTTGTRTPKQSYHWYREVISSNGESLRADPSTVS